MRTTVPLARRAPLLVLAASAAMLLAAYLFQHIGGLQPCPLCVAQRYAHFAALGLALAALVARGRPRALPLGAAGLALLVGTGIATYHVGVEQGWLASSCATGLSGETIEDLRASLMAAPITPCDEVAWSLAGISMAGWNALLSLALAGVALYAGIRLWKGER